jgi:DNA-binding MarR family transcriptional regulator
MSQYLTIHERLVLDVLGRSDSLTIEQLTAQLPELSWSTLFQAIDSLSRKGTIVLRRKGFEYELRTHHADVV